MKMRSYKIAFPQKIVMVKTIAYNAKQVIREYEITEIILLCVF